MFKERFFEEMKNIQLVGSYIQIIDRNGQIAYEENNGVNFENTYKYVQYIENNEFDLSCINIFVDQLVHGDNSAFVGEVMAQLILKELFCFKLIEEQKKIERFHDYMANSLEDALLILDKNGYVIYYNKKALEIVQAPEKVIKTRPLQDFYTTKLKVMEVLSTGVPVHNQEVFVTTKSEIRKHLLKTILPIIDKDGNVIGVMDKIKEIDSAKRFITNMSGNRACFTFDSIIHESEEMKRVIKVVKNVSDTPMIVLIQGESGTGKELFAHAIHNESSRASNPFVILDCSAIPKELVESELFGYVEGAFTGAKKGGKLGKFELAHGGTIFLDEIGEMPLDIQAKLLRVLQSGTFTKVGGSELMEVDIRVIAATNRDLREEVRQKNFREDLYYRLNMMPIEIPPLRERKEDIVLLAQYFVKSGCIRLNRENVTINEETMKIMLGYNWPGNIRELENAMYRAVSLCGNQEILPIHLPEAILNTSKMKKNPRLEAESHPDLLEKAEMQQIIKSLDANDWNKRKTAEDLGISRSTLYRRMEKYGISL